MREAEQPIFVKSSFRNSGHSGLFIKGNVFSIYIIM